MHFIAFLFRTKTFAFLDLLVICTTDYSVYYSCVPSPITSSLETKIHQPTLCIGTPPDIMYVLCVKLMLLFWVEAFPDICLLIQ